MAKTTAQLKFKKVDLDLFIYSEEPEKETGYSGHFEITKIEIAGIDVTELLDDQIEEIITDLLNNEPS